MKKLNLPGVFIIGCAILSSAMANGGSYIKDVKITHMLNTADEEFGGCMLKLTEDIDTVLTNCPSSWVTLSCNGKLDNSVAQASAMWSSAQMAFALDKQITLRVTKHKINGFCYADLIRVLN